MADLGSIAALRTYINTWIKANYNQEITGPVANSVFQNVIDTLAGLINVANPKEIRCKTETLVEGENTVSHPTSFTAGKTYTMVWVCYDSNGIVNSYEPTNLTVTGFKIVVDAACTIIYIATEN